MMATKKKPTPQPIEHRGLTFVYNKTKRWYTTKYSKVCVYQPSRATWIATVNVEMLCPDEDNPLIYGRAKTPQEAIDMALDAAVNFLNAHICLLIEEKTDLLKIRNS